MKRLLFALSIAAFGLLYIGTAGAFTQSVTGTMSIGATVLASCTVSTTPMDFGSYTGAAYSYANSTITVNCSVTTPYRIDIDKGQNVTGISGYPRNVKTGTAPADATNTIKYKLYKASTYSAADEWGDNGATLCTTCTTTITGKNGTGTGLDEPHTVYGVLWPTSNAPGVYSDVVTVTVNY